MAAVVALLLQAYVNGPVPASTVTLAEPLLSPQVVVAEVDDNLTVSEEPTLSLAVAEHPPKPVTVTL
jgi:hypothetical protein